MKARYDEATDTLTLILRDAVVAESDEDNPGVILDYDEDGSLVAMEVLDASTIIDESLRGRLARTTAKPRTKLTTTGRGGLLPGIDLDDSATLLDAMDGGE